MADKLITQEELDGRLDRLADDTDRFADRALELARELDASGADLELRDPLSWRKRLAPMSDTRVSIENQLRHEIESIELMDREAEAKLARRIEFARIRLELALEREGLSTEDLEGSVSATPGLGMTPDHLSCSLPGKVCRRWLELHHLRLELVERNLYLVLINVERYSHTSASKVDLIQEGAASLFRAVDGFDWRRGLLFRTYAVHWLNQAFRSYLYNFSNTVRVPVYLQKAMKHVNAAIEKLGNPDADPAEIAKVAGLGENLVEAALSASRGIRSLDTTLGDEKEVKLSELLLSYEPEDGPYTTDLEDLTLSEGIDQALERLSDRERFVVRMRFGIGMEREHTLAEVAKDLGVSLERVRQIQVRAISKMNSPALRKAIDPFLH